MTDALHPVPTLFLDSNVVDEIYTVVDLGRELGGWQGALCSPAPLISAEWFRGRAERRRLRAQGSLWMVMGLDSVATTTMNFHGETFRFITRNAAPSSWAGGWVANWLYFVARFVCPRWQTIAWQPDSDGGNAANDRLIAAECHTRGIPLATRDAVLAKRANGLGVRARPPEDIAMTLMSLQDARRTFFDRFDMHAIGWGYEWARDFGRDVNTAWKVLEIVRRIYAVIWAGENEPWEVRLSMGERDLVQRVDGLLHGAS